jgi:hypothetical protein
MKIPVENKTKMPIYVGSYMIAPGETRHFDEEDVPEHLRPAADAPVEVAAPTDPLAELLDGNVATVIAALTDLSLEDIERIGDLEQAGLARKGVLSAVAEELLARAGV